MRVLFVLYSLTSCYALAQNEIVRHNQRAIALLRETYTENRNIVIAPFDQSSIDTLTAFKAGGQMSLTNGIFSFSPSWDYPFDPQRTKQGTFDKSEYRDGSVSASFMQVTARFNSSYSIDARLIELPINDSLLMVIVFPKTSRPKRDIMSTIDQDGIAAEFYPDNIQVTIPKFSIRSNPGDSTTFSSVSILVDEHGRQVVRPKGPFRRNLTILTIDRPFVFFVMTRISRAIILEGVVHHPERN